MDRGAKGPRFLSIYKERKIDWGNLLIVVIFIAAVICRRRVGLVFGARCRGRSLRRRCRRGRGGGGLLVVIWHVAQS